MNIDLNFSDEVKLSHSIWHQGVLNLRPWTWRWANSKVL